MRAITRACARSSHLRLCTSLSKKQHKHSHYSFRGKFSMKVFFSQPQCINQKHFWAVFRIPMPLQPLPLIIYVVAVNTTPVDKNFHTHSVRSSRLHSCSSWPLLTCTCRTKECNNNTSCVYFRRTSTPMKILYNENFLIVIIGQQVYILERSNAEGKLCKHLAIPPNCSGGTQYLMYQK